MDQIFNKKSRIFPDKVVRVGYESGLWVGLGLAGLK